MEFIALGDTDDVAASCHFVRIHNTGLVLDAGVDPRRDGRASLPNFDIIHSHRDRYVNHALITHAHHDHLGGLPVLVQEFPNVVAHMTEATHLLAEMLLPASARLQRRQREEGTTDADPLFTEDEAELYQQLYLTHQLQQTFDVTGHSPTPVKARFYDAGHILGSVGVALQFEEEGQTRDVFYTSDTNVKPQSIIAGASYPNSTDVLILESTLGSDPEAEQTTRGLETKRFTELLQRTLKRGGTALIPVFVMGRAQEMIAVLGQLKRQGKIPDDVPIYTAGSMRGVADIYDRTRNNTPRLDSDFRVFGVSQERLPYSDSGLREALKEPSIMVVSSGMMFEPTLSNRLGRRLIEDEKNAVLLVGYSKEDTPARRLLDAAAEGPGTEVVLSEARGPQPVRCAVERFRFSGHSNRRELLDIVATLSPDTVVLVHGEPAARAWMQEQIEERHPTVTVHKPDGGEVLTL